MNRIKELFNAILLKEESLSIINEYNLKKIPLFFLITNIGFPFIYNICYLILKEDINISNVMSILYFTMWNIIINLALIFSLWLIFYISKKEKIQLFIKAVIFMNLLQPLEVFLSYVIDSFLITAFFIIYDIFFVSDYIQVNIKNSELSKKQLTIYVLFAFLLVFIFLCIIDNEYMLFGERIF